MPLNRELFEQVAAISEMRLRIQVALVRGYDVARVSDVSFRPWKLTRPDGGVRFCATEYEAWDAAPAYESDLRATRELMDEMDANAVVWELRGPRLDTSGRIMRAAVARWGLLEDRAVGFDPNPAAAFARAYLATAWSLRVAGAWRPYAAPLAH